jgi:molecular chaperone GrpE (heat shock protein)
VDATRHRVVRVQSREEDRPGIVVEVVRPGYRSNGRVLREADVVATSQRRES